MLINCRNPRVGGSYDRAKPCARHAMTSVFRDEIQNAFVIEHVAAAAAAAERFTRPFNYMVI